METIFSSDILARMLENPILDVDSYKPSQFLQYPNLTEFIESYIESRGGRYPYVVVCGLQIYLKKYLSRPITMQMIDDAEMFLKAHGEPFNRKGWEYILNKHNGYFPLKIMAVKEGAVVPVHNCIVKVINTDPNCGWLTSYVETALLRAIWYPTTVATVSASIKQVIKKYLLKTHDNLDSLPFKLHDFGARGVSSKESAGIGGMAHLINFKGSDTITGALYSMYYYNSQTMTAYSVPASEHSTITSWLRKGERQAYANMLKQFGGKYSVFSVVSDSYDIFNAAEIWSEMKDDIIRCGSMLVIRPDSGDPVSVVTKLILLLDSKFGHTMNSKGYRVLNHVRILQGDGIDEKMIEGILCSIMGYGFSAENLVFGMGGALLQKIDRDMQKFAMKASAGFIDDQWVDIYKDPITDSGKKSKRGRQMLYQNADNQYITDREGNLNIQEALLTVWENGKLLIDWSFEEVRKHAEEGLYV